MFNSVPNEEVYRKLVHGFVIVLPLGVFYGPNIFAVERSFFLFLSLGMLLYSLLIEFIRFRYPAFGSWFMATFGSMLREEEKKQISGASYMAGATFLCAWLSTISESFAACACLSLTLFILGDAAAALVGKSIGRIRIGKKTLEGAIACFLLCMVLAYWVFPILPVFLVKWGGAFYLWQAACVAAMISLLELFPVQTGKVRWNDNLYVPVVVTLFAAVIR
jgi:dolichol kinase